MSVPIQYSGPKVSLNVPQDIRFHLQQIYQKLGNHTQAFELLKGQLGTVETTAATAGGGTSGGSHDIIGPLNEVLLGNGPAPVSGVPSVSAGYVLTDAGTMTPPAYAFPFVSAKQYAFANLPGSPILGELVVVTDSTVNTWGTAITVGGGALFVLAWYNGAAWTVVGA
jgi:hypothetical protein